MLTYFISFFKSNQLLLIWKIQWIKSVFLVFCFLNATLINDKYSCLKIASHFNRSLHIIPCSNCNFILYNFNDLDWDWATSFCWRVRNSFGYNRNISRSSNFALLFNISNGKVSAVPRHNEISDFLVRKICRDLGIPIVWGSKLEPQVSIAF